MSLTIAPPVKSPSIDAYGNAVLTDQSGNRVPIVALVVPDASGNLPLTGLTNPVIPGQVSQVTGLEGAPQVKTPSGMKVPLLAAMSLDAAGNLVPGVAAGSALGKFQSAVRVATGSQETIAHGLGVVPKVVLIAVQDNTGVATVVCVEGTHTSTNLLVTVTSGAKYKVIALS